MDNLIDLFCHVDDFCKEIEPWLERKLLEHGVKHNCGKPSRLCLSEIITIIIHFHQSHYRDFKNYYLHHVQKFLQEYFPDLVSYNRFVELMPRSLLPLTLLIYWQKKNFTGIYFIDSTPLEICHIKREKANKVFKNLAKKSKSTKGWFFGFKLHIIINDKGDIIAFKLTSANTDDRGVVKNLSKNLFGKLIGDKGYISKQLFEELLQQGLQLITKLKKNMKNILMPLLDKLLLRKRAIVETIIDQLKNISQIEHSRHRSISNFLVNVVAGLVAYSLKEKKPSLNLETQLIVV